MKVLFDHSEPFLLAHGGFQTQIEQTRLALLECGVEVEFLEWWNPAQTGDILHFFGRPSPTYIQLARQKGLRTVFTALHGSLGARSPLKLFLQKAATRGAETFVPALLLERLAWESYRKADACVVLTRWEARLVQYLFKAPAGRIQVIPNGIAPVFSRDPDVRRDKWLVTTASILPIKRLIETGQAAVQAGTPYWVVGKPFSEADSYFQRWLCLCREHPDLLRYEGSIADRQALAAVYRQARGFVLLSRYETLSVSALEAAGCGCPLLLSDLPWARVTFGQAATYCPLTTSVKRTAGSLREFYDTAPGLPAPPRPASWKEVGLQLKALYEGLLSTSR